MENKLKTFINDHNINIQDLAQNLNISAFYINKIINSCSNNSNFELSTHKTNLLIKYLNCKPEDILNDLQLYIYINNTYPRNLLNAISGVDKNSEDYNKILEEFDHNLELIYKELPNVFNEKEKLVINYRFKEGYTLKECGEICNVTRERIRQIEYKILVKLNKNRDVKYILVYGEELWRMNYKIRELEKQELKLKEKSLIDHIAKLSNEKFDYLLKSNDELLYYNIDILKFSSRTYSCLKRAGIHSIQDLITVTSDDLKNISSLGRKSIIEIIETLKEYNIKLKYEDNIKNEFKID